MDPLLEQHNTTDDGYDNLIAFLVLAGALAFILHQSFPSTSNLNKSTTTAAISPSATTPKKVYAPKQTKNELTAQERQQAERDFANDALHKWTDDLDAQAIDNTPYRIPKTPTKELAVAATTVPLTNSAPEITPTEDINLSKKEIIKEVPPGTTVVTEEAVFIDTDSKKSTDTPAKTVTKNIVKEVEKTKDVSLSTAKETVAKEVTDAKIPSKNQLVDNYEANIPAIAPVTTKKGITATPKKKTAVAKKKPAEPSCVVMIAALKDAKNIKRLVTALKKEKYKVYNKASGNHRAIGIRTSCDPAVNQPLLRKVKKDYSETAWLLKR